MSEVLSCWPNTIRKNKILSCWIYSSPLAYAHILVKFFICSSDRMLTVCKVYSSEKNRQMSLPSGSLKHIVFVCNAFLTNKNCVICRTDPVPIISPSVLFLIGPYCYAYGRSDLLTVAQPYSTMCIHHVLIIYSPTGGHLSCF